ncbi:hypothetical protein FB567DRAFT_201124 [Paraphoma chrysanthemicola]|uniref:RanBD1 domain-containing protein n=1 Tax=Paraphoma chrysanthemicola TaxID=798071 RepID=A0A8K0QV04_9PLEO|nr:hypothetical protein FB567DRAFT_201124 [Paraphoma chrysanthemicola]
MAGSVEQQEAAIDNSSAAEHKSDAQPAPTSPARSDKSSDSEGKPVRDKLKETRIDAQGTTDAVPSVDKNMDDVVNGHVKGGERSASGSDSDRGRLRRKRSREDFEDDNEGEKQPEKKQEKDKEERHHVRKRSRDVKDIESGTPLKPPTASVARIDEDDGDEPMTTPRKDTSKAAAIKTGTITDTSPKNKRTRDQAEEAVAANNESKKETVTNGTPGSKADEERDTKRLRDKEDAQPASTAASLSAKTTFGSGFANTSQESPFATMSTKPQAPKTSDRPELIPQTSEDKFKSSTFGAFAKAESSPFGALAKEGSKSPFAAAGGSKLNSFAGSAAPPVAPSSGFGALGGSTKSAFGGSAFGGSLGGGFSALGGSKPALSSFGMASADLTIKGLKSKATAFGTPGEDKNDDASDEEDGEEDEGEKDTAEEERRSSQALLSQQPHETGEEGENTVWTGRAKLYAMAGETGSRAWKERGAGTFKFNVTVDEPKKARFVLRADGTHRLLLNAAVNKQLVFGGDAKGQKPKDGRLLFNSPNADGELEMHLLRLKAERAVELWEEVSKVQELEL